MKNRVLKKILTVVLSATLVVQSGGAAFAAPADTAINEESTDSLVNAEVSENETASDNKIDPEDSVSNADAGSDPVENIDSSDNEENSPAVDPGVSENETGSGQETEDTVSEEAAGDDCVSVSENVTSDETAEEPSGKDVLFAAGSLDTELLFTHLNDVEMEVFEDFKDLDEEAAGSDYAADRVFFDAESESEAESVAEMYDAKLVSFQEEVGVIELKEEGLSLSDAVMCSLYDEDVTVRVYPDYIKEIYDEPYTEEDAAGTVDADYNDPKYDVQWQHGAISDNDAWSITKGKGARVAVIDTGISRQHEDLVNNIEAAYVCGYKTPEDEHSHGSHCSGIIAAELNNGKGGAGVAPEAKIISIRAASAQGRLQTSDVVAAINKAVKEKVNVISMSFGSPSPTDSERKALEKAVENGITPVGSAGNDGVNSMNYPAAFDCVIAIASYDKKYKLSDFSNYGDWVDLAAPGSNIYSCVKNGEYGTMSGTSMACPMVSGVVAMMYASSDYYTKPENANAETVQIIKEALLESCDERKYVYGGHSVKKGVNARDAVLKAKELADVIEKDRAVEVTVPGKPAITGETDSKTGAVTVKISGIADGAECFYTTDGTVPSMSSQKYTASTGIVFSKAGEYTVKAVAVNKAPISTGYKYASSEVALLKVKVTIPKSAEYSDAELSVRANVGSKISVIPGGKVTLSGTVSPNNASTKKVTFEISEQSGSSIAVDSKGVVKVSSTASAGERAVIKLGISGKNLPAGNYDTVEVTVKPSGISSLTSSFGNEEQTIYTVAPPNAGVSSNQTSLDIAASLTPGPDENIAFKYESSNKKAAVVDKNGIVKAVGNGKSRITVTAMDGSGKKTVVKVKCITPVVGISLNAAGGYPVSLIAKGKSIVLKPEFTGTNGLKPSNTKLIWDTGSSTVKVNKKGKVTATKDAAEGQIVTVTCTSEDGNINAEYKLKVKGAVKYMGVLKKTVAVYRRMLIWRSLLYYKNVYAKTATADKTYMAGTVIDVTSPARVYSSEKDLVYAATNKFKSDKDTISKIMEDEAYIVKVKPAKGLIVNSVDEYGSVESISATEKGTYKVIYQAIDGSGKKFTLKIKVK